jgi:hypothetical protein
MLKYIIGTIIILSTSGCNYLFPITGIKGPATSIDKTQTTETPAGTRTVRIRINGGIVKEIK